VNAPFALQLTDSPSLKDMRYSHTMFAPEYLPCVLSGQVSLRHCLAYLPASGRSFQAAPAPVAVHRAQKRWSALKNRLRRVQVPFCAALSALLLLEFFDGI
jgi:hypothetical protein